MNEVKPIFKMLILTIFLVVHYSFVIASTTTTKKNSINLSFTDVDLEQDGYSYNNHLYGLSLDYSRYLNNFLSVGAYLGAGKYNEWVYLETEKHKTYYTNSTMGNSFSYGLSGRLQILPLIFKKENSKFDLYINGELGSIAMNSSTDKIIIPAKGNFFDYSLMGGASIYLSKYFGVFVQTGFRNFEYHHGWNTKFGLSARF